MLTKYSKHSKSDAEIEYYYDEAIKYLKSEPEETIDERVKLMPRKRKKQELESKPYFQTNYRLYYRPDFKYYSTNKS